MSVTIILPSGIKVRSQSNRRFIVIREENGRGTILKRSDNIATARSTRNRIGFGGFIFDTSTRSFVR